MASTCDFCSNKIAVGHADDFRLQLDTFGARVLDVRFCCYEHYEAFICFNFHNHNESCDLQRSEHQVETDKRSEEKSESSVAASNTDKGLKIDGATLRTAGINLVGSDMGECLRLVQKDYEQGLVGETEHEQIDYAFNLCLTRYDFLAKLV